MENPIAKSAVLTAIFLSLGAFKVLRRGGSVYSAQFAILAGACLLAGIVVAVWPLLSKGRWSWGRVFVTYLVLMIALAWTPAIVLHALNVVR